MDEKDLAEHDFRTAHSSGRTLQEYADEERSATKDIYDTYRQQAQEKSKLEQMRADTLEEQRRLERLETIYDEAKESTVKAPGLEDFFEREAKGKSPIDNFSGVDFEESAQDEELRRIMEEHGASETYRRELLARMFGGKLTARQYGVLANMAADEQDQLVLDRKDEAKTKLAAQTAIRTAEEAVESWRRRMVHSG